MDQNVVFIYVASSVFSLFFLVRINLMETSINHSWEAHIPSFLCQGKKICNWVTHWEAVCHLVMSYCMSKIRSRSGSSHFIFFVNGKMQQTYIEKC